MVITRTPFRISFLGGGTDYKPFFEEYGGSVLSTTFDKYCYVTCRHLLPFFDYKNQVTYSKIERVTGVDGIEHPLVREAMRFLDMRELSIFYEADLPARSGLGSSSAFAVGLLAAFYALKGKYADKKKLAGEAIHLERILCGEDGGWQDQVAAAYGGFNRVNFTGEGFDVMPLIISRERKNELNRNLMLFFTGITRFSSVIAQKQAQAATKNTKDLLEMKKLVDEGERILTSKTDIKEFGRLLDYTWRLKRRLSSGVSSDYIDTIYSKALNCGAIDGKILGAGGGGFLLLFAPPDAQSAVRAALSDLIYVPFEFEDKGTHVLYFVPEEYGERNV